ncbi:MAG: hypothetical protein JRD89_20235 [Deltaproteobacteria bacterium]|nr:hypothetical protein [Deltaproteobacteria bacterium]
MPKETMTKQAAPPPEVMRRFRADASYFIETAFGDNLWSMQREILQTISSHSKVAVKSCHGIGKTWLAARAALWFLFTRRPALVVTTAPTAHQVENLLWKEIRIAWAHLPEELRGLGRCLNTQIKFVEPKTHEDIPGHIGYGRSTDDPLQFQGVHGPHLMAIVDEAAGVDDEIYEALDTWSAGGEYRELLIGNPTRNDGKFYRAFQNPELHYSCLSVPVENTPNWTGEDTPDSIRRLLIQPEKVEEWASDWGEDSPTFLSRVKAEFPEGDATSILVPLSWMERAQQRTYEYTDESTRQVGVDVARFGVDQTCIACRIGPDLVRLRSYAGKTDMLKVGALVVETVEWMQNTYGGHVLVLIDETGVGGGLVDILRPQSSQFVTYEGVTFGAAAHDKEKFVCARDELLWGLRLLAATGNNDPDLCISAADTVEVGRLCAQLSAMQYTYNERAKIKIESKDKIRERGLPSPDETDAVALSYYAGQASGGYYGVPDPDDPDDPDDAGRYADSIEGEDDEDFSELSEGLALVADR